MSDARRRFLGDIQGISEAVSLDPIAAGAMAAAPPQGIVILRRGILIASLIAYETFIRERTTELLADLGRWPARFQDLPQRLRDAALLNALSHLQRFATVLKRQQENYEAEIIAQLEKMAANRGPEFAFTKFISGDHTGNISDQAVKDLLKTFQVEDCWGSFRSLSSDIGFGVPSVQQILIDVVGKRHRSAHSAGFVPAASDIAELPRDLLCLGICFDAAMTGSVTNALNSWRSWSDGTANWRNALDIYLVDAQRGRFRITKPGGARAVALINLPTEAAARLPPRPPGKRALLVHRDGSNLPREWTIV
ncbi:hypothetical protein I6F26_28750 [Ensifer sp. IC3342]|nr:hypothetical protein [Ensifer sp. BRP08]MCA1450533.1 hypothetical protein [Ensifer sp. IC3342]